MSRFNYPNHDILIGGYSSRLPTKVEGEYDNLLFLANNRSKINKASQDKFLYVQEKMSLIDPYNDTTSRLILKNGIYGHKYASGGKSSSVLKNGLYNREEIYQNVSTLTLKDEIYDDIYSEVSNLPLLPIQPLKYL